jgi:hypothetical protein
LLQHLLTRTIGQVANELPENFGAESADEADSEIPDAAAALGDLSI